MKDKDFDKIFSDKLHEDRHLPFEEKDWDMVSKRLEDSDSFKASLNNVQNKYWRWLLPLLLLLLGFNAWILTKMTKTQSENETLINEMKSVKTLLEKQNDNAKQQPQIIYKTDTVILYKTVYKTIPPAYSFQNAQQPIKTTPSVFEPILTTINGVNNVGITKNIADSANIVVKNIPENNIPIEQTKDVVKHLSTLGLPTQVSYTSKPDIVFLKENTSIIKPIDNVQNRLYLGWSGGSITYHTQWFNKDNIEFSRNEQSYQTGIKAEFALNSNWRITGATDYCPYAFKINWQDKRYNLPPLPSAYTPTKYTMKSIEGSQKMYLGSIGLKYLFQGNRIRPYLGIAYAAMRIAPYSAVYTYGDAWKTYTSEEYLTKGINIMNVAHLQGGLEFKIGKNLLLQTDGFYYKDINKVEKTFDLFGLRGGVLYGF
jgi:uncharacterized protein YozE (UPF0346 family)